MITDRVTESGMLDSGRRDIVVDADRLKRTLSLFFEDKFSLLVIILVLPATSILASLLSQK
jgi:hypothetical protein